MFDSVDYGIAIAGENTKIITQKPICLSISRINEQRTTSQRIDLIGSGYDDDVVFPHMEDDFRAYLLIPPSQQISLASDGREDEHALLSFDQFLYLCFVQIFSD